MIGVKCPAVDGAYDPRLPGGVCVAGFAFARGHVADERAGARADLRALVAHVGEVLLALRPKIHAKGPDYSIENLPERDIVKQIGAELVIMGGQKERSVSALLKRIRSA